MKWPTNLEFQDVATFVARFLDFCHKKLELELRDEYRLAPVGGSSTKLPIRNGRTEPLDQGPLCKNDN